ncbi:MAG: hypothetical protein IPM29_28240 [Planctomycetes bacterium]|nr:hypothetical protein [Planctomycetota bacterium]
MSVARRPLILVLALVALAALAAAVRSHPAVMSMDETGIDFRDADTVRRLVKLNSMDTSETYPVLEVRDGYPEGTTIQWSLPMDFVIRGLDAVAPRLHPLARKYESGAALAGPVLGTLAVLAFALLAWRLLPRGQAALAALLYAVSAPGVEVTRLGNGDHQSLQLLCAVVAMLGGLAVVVGRGRTPLAVLSGALLGLSIWVNAESMLVLIVDGLTIVVGLGLTAAQDARTRLTLLLQHAVACAVVTVAGMLAEGGGRLTLEWDRVSCFQVAATLGLVALVWLARRLVPRWRHPAAGMWAAAAIAGALVAGPFLLVPALHTKLVSELTRMATFASFCLASVNEYQALFANGLGLARLVFGATLFMIPFCFIGLFFARQLSPALRAGLVIPNALLGALVLTQVKLSHMFSIPWALMIPAGGVVCVDLVARSLHVRTERVARLRLGAALLVAASALWNIGMLTFTELPDDGTAARRELVAGLARLEFTPRSETEAGRMAVMAPWDLGHYLLYDTDKPVVASSYQRRVDGIRDSFDVMCAMSPEEARAILQRRRVRWWVRPASPKFLTQYHLVVPGKPELGRVVQGPSGPAIALSPVVKESFWYATAPGNPLPAWLEPVFTTDQQEYQAPAFRVFLVRYADEGR